MTTEVYQVALSFDRDATDLDTVLSSLRALIDYAIEANLGYDELTSVEVEP